MYYISYNTNMLFFQVHPATLGMVEIVMAIRNGSLGGDPD